MDSTNYELRDRGTGGKGPNESVMSHSRPQISGEAARDGAIMTHLGKRQQFNRNFGFLTILALSSTLLSSWEAVSGVLGAGLTNGGPVGLVYGMMLSLTGTMAMAASLAEMASICPISGAQYHWTAIFAPPRWAAFFTWMQGWITVFAWQATVTSECFIFATQIQALAVLNNPSYTNPQRWHGTFIMWAILALTFVVNVWGIKLLPLIELIGGICHIAFFPALLIPLIVLAPRSSAEFVFTEFINDSGWKSDGVSWCVGMLSVTFCFVGFDGAIHMSEEVRNAATTVPKILIWTIVINGTMAFGFVICVLFYIGNVQNALNTSTGYPIIEIWLQATGSVKAATLMQSALLIVGFGSVFASLASVSRLTWAFARDEGLPFSKFFAYVNPHYRIPIRAISLVTLVVVLLSFINIGSSTAFNAILSLSTLALYISYLIPISILMHKRLRPAGNPIVFGPFTLGRFGIWINLWAMIYGIFICIFLPFPAYIPVTAVNMNYAGPVFIGVIVFGLCDWAIRGRGKFVGPIREIDENEVQEDSPDKLVSSI